VLPGYRIIREIHRGGQGIVFEAIQESTQRTVAVKILLQGDLAGERARWRFEQEVRLVAQLRHANIVTVHDSGIHQGRYFYAMDYVRGQPLDSHVRSAERSIPQIVRLFVEVCDAVSYAHQHGVIHRDLKPSNILVGQDGRPQVLDFGLAKIVGAGEQAGDASVTVAGQIMGTVRYMSPEQTKGEPDSIDVRTDVYSLGVILYELLTGVPPYPTNLEFVTALQNIRVMDPVRPSRVRRELNSELDAIVLRSMAKEPERRYQSANQFMADLVAWLERRPVIAKSDSSLYVLRKLASRHYFHTSAIVALLAGLVGFGGVSYHFQLQAREALERQRISDMGNQMASKDMSRFFVDAQAALRQQSAGWLLLEL
jgi:serine/threonine protein kinase